jgi:hypothetical protein
MLMYLEEVRLTVRADSRDELVTAEGFMQAQAELPVDAANPYFTPEPGYGKRKLLQRMEWVSSENWDRMQKEERFFEGKENNNFRTNCFAANTYNPEFPNLVFKSMNNETNTVGHAYAPLGGEHAAAAADAAGAAAHAPAAAAALGDTSDDHALTLCYGNNNPDLSWDFCSGICHSDAHVNALRDVWANNGGLAGSGRNGQRKGKVCPPFTMNQRHALCYGNRYEDLQKAKCRAANTDGTCISYWQAEELRRHYDGYGKHEGRVYGCAPDPGALCYGNRYPDLQRELCDGKWCRSLEQDLSLVVHYNTHGVHQRRRWGCDLSESEGALCYGNRYPDLQRKHCGGSSCHSLQQSSDLLTHYHTYGRIERRHWGCESYTQSVRVGNIQWRASSGKMPTEKCTRNGYCPQATGSMIENDASHPVCPDDSLMSGFIFTRDDQSGCRCTGCSDKFKTNAQGVTDLETMNRGNKMSISYNCVQQASYAAPFGECRVDYHAQMAIQRGGHKVTDLMVLESFTVACGRASPDYYFRQTLTVAVCSMHVCSMQSLSFSCCHG